MPDDGPTSERLESLRARWDAESGSGKASGVFLQLADELRRLERREDAIQVLEEGLAKHPNHPAALVALGRCRLEIGRAEEASEVLERVIASDPTQMVAYRLLVEAYVERGMPEEARQRLRVYSLLNDADPEIAELRRRIGEVERRHRDGSGPAGDALPADEPAGRDQEETVPEDAAESAEAADPAAGPAVGRAAPGDVGRAREPGPGSSPVVDDPFPFLADPEAEERYHARFAAEGWFPGEEGGEPTSSPPAQEPDEAPEPAPGAQPFEGVAAADEAGEPSRTPAAPDDLFGLGAPPAPRPPDLSSLLGDRSAAPPEQSSRPEAAPEDAELAPPRPVAAPAPPVAPEEPPVPPAKPSAPPAEPEAGRPTVTLGRLYLRQGHRDEAAAIFRQVLDRDPGNSEARAELDALAASGPAGGEGEPAGLTAADLLRERPGTPPPQGLTGRKRLVLERYLERIRGGTERDVR